jgi:hypothetical protein
MVFTPTCNATLQAIVTNCSSSAAELAGLRFCDMLSDPTNILGHCFNTIKPMAFYRACVNDYCAGQVATALLSITTYYDMCVRNGVTQIQRPTDICGVLAGDDSTCVNNIGVCSAVGNSGFDTYVSQDVAFSAGGTYTLTTSCIDGRFNVEIIRVNMSMATSVSQTAIAIKRSGKPTITLLPFKTEFAATTATRADWAVAAILTIDRLAVVPLFNQLLVLVNDVVVAFDSMVYPGDVITLLNGHVLVDGTTLQQLPYAFSDGTSVAMAAGILTVRLESGLVVKLGRSGLVQTLAPRFMQGDLCGLCGTFDPTTVALLYLRNTTSVPASGLANQWAFGASWIVNATPPRFEPPSSSCPEVAVNNPICALLDENGTNYSPCFARVSPSLYSSNCRAMACALRDPCDIAKSYESACSSAGVSLVSIVDSCGVCRGDGSTCSTAVSSCSLWSNNVLFMAGGSVRIVGTSRAYTFASDCSAGLFAIITRYQPMSPALDAVAVSFGGSNVLFMFNNRTAVFNGLAQNLASIVALPRGSTLSLISGVFEVLIQPYGMVFTWDLGINTVSLSSPASYVSFICGLCNSGLNSVTPLGPLSNLTVTQCKTDPPACLTAIPPSWGCAPAGPGLP